MAQADKKQKAFTNFIGGNGTRQIRIPEFDVQFMRDEKLQEIAASRRKTKPKHAAWLGEYSDSRILVERKEGDEFASAVYSFDEEASKLLLAAGAKFVRLVSFPVTGRKPSAQDERLATVLALRKEFGLPCHGVSNPPSRSVSHAGA